MKALRVNRKRGISHHHNRPEAGAAAHKAPLKLRDKPMHAQPEDECSGHKCAQNHTEMRSERRSVPEASAVELRVSQQLPRDVCRNCPKQRKSGDPHRREAVSERQRDKEQQQFQNESGCVTSWEQHNWMVSRIWVAGA